MRHTVVHVPVCSLKTVTYRFTPLPGTYEMAAWVYLNGTLRYTFKRPYFRTITIPRPNLPTFSVRVVNELSNGAEFQRSAHYAGCQLAPVTLIQIRGATKHATRRIGGGTKHSTRRILRRTRHSARRS